MISGFTYGIQISPQGSAANEPGPTIQGNKIGTDVTGTLAIPNSVDGISIVSSPAGGITIGGTDPGDGNTIANSGRYGVYVNSGTGPCSILGNSIFANGNLGINLNGAPDGFFGPVTANDPGDSDTGPNGLQNNPVLGFAGPAGSQTVVVGSLNSTPNTTFRLEIFANDAADPSGFGEGQTFLGFTNVTTDGAGDAAFTATLPGTVSIGQFVSATATDPAGNTSEFSLDVTAASLDVIIDASTTQEFLDSLTVIHGNLIMVGVAGRTDLILPNLTEVDGDIKICDNPDLTTLSVPMLTTVGGDVEICDNPKLTAVNLGSVSTVGGSVNVSGDTGATSIDLGSLNTAGGSVNVSGDTGATSIDLGSLNTAGGSVNVSGDTGATSIDLGTLNTAGGSVNVSGDTGATSIDLGSLNTAGGSVNVSGDTAATSIDLGSLNTAGGDLEVSGNSSMTALSIGSATGVGGSVSISDNDSLPSLLLPSLIDVGGDFILTANPTLTMFDVPQLTSIGGDADVSNNPSMMTVDLSSFANAGDSVSINGDTSATGIDLGSLTSVSGSVSINDDTSATGIDLGSLTSVSGSVSINDDTSATGIDLGSLTSVSGSVSINDDTSATGIDLGSLTSVSGSVSINDDTSATGIDLGSLTSVGGSISIDGDTSATGIDLSSLTSVGGDETLEAMDSITAVTADGSTELTLFSAEAQMTALLAAGTYDHAVAFTVIRLDPAALPPESGQDSTGAAAIIDPLAAYQFNFDIPTLGQEASLTFEINLAALSSADRTAFLAALAANNGTVAVKNDAPGSVFHAFAIAAPGQQPDATHITISQPDANHVVFQGITGHFSTFAVVTVSPTSGNSPPLATDDMAALDTSASASVTINVLANDVDLNGDTLTVTAITQPASGHGVVTINADNTLTYTQTVYVNRIETFTYTISDGHGGTATATVTVAVNLPAAVGIDMLLNQVQESGLSRGRKNSLTTKLVGAQRSWPAAIQSQRRTRCWRSLSKSALSSATDILPADVADLWLFESFNILRVLGWEFAIRR